MKIHELEWLMSHREILSAEDMEILRQHHVLEQYEKGELHLPATDMVKVLTLLADMYEKYQKEAELVQYFVVNKELNMSSGKIAAQVAHVAALISDYCSKREDSGVDEVQYYRQWIESKNRKIIILAGKEKALLKLIDQGWLFNRDNGLTEVPAGSLTCVGYFPMPKYQMKQTVKRFQVL
jgi:PTH2 family peptidyl-tRNA hydrolase